MSVSCEVCKRAFDAEGADHNPCASGMQLQLQGLREVDARQREVVEALQQRLKTDAECLERLEAVYSADADPEQTVMLTLGELREIVRTARRPLDVD